MSGWTTTWRKAHTRVLAAAPRRSDAAGLSFVGAKFPDAVVARVRITLGTGILSGTVNDVSAGGTTDVVVTDNFIYGEPKRIP